MTERSYQTRSSSSSQSSNAGKIPYRQLVEYSRDILIFLDRNGVIQYVNSSVIRTLGFLPEDLMGRRKISHIIHSDHRRQVCQKIVSLLKGNEISIEFVTKIKHQNGDWRTLEFHGNSLLGQSGPCSVILTAREVTKNVEAQQQVQQLLKDLRHTNSELAEERLRLAERIDEQTAQLRSANSELARALRTRDEFLANMSHELRTPLTSILGQSELLLEGIHGALSADQDSSVQMIQLSGQHLLDLINDILELVKLEAGRTELHFQRVSAETACIVSSQLLHRQAMDKQISVELPSHTQETYVQADERRLHQILANLLSNAIKFTPVGGEVGMRIIDDGEKEAVHIIVWDTGIGIHKNDMKRLFQPFTQLDASLGRHHEGTGLGLALVYQLTEMQGGSVAVQSTPGKGSRFTVSLPQAKVHNEDLPDITVKPLAVDKIAALRTKESENPKGATRGLRILLAEDNHDNVDTISQYLTYLGHSVAVAVDGREAIEMAMDGLPDLIIMDMQMPVIDGIEATRQLRLQPDLVDTPVIALTGLAMPGDKEGCLAAGANAYMSKPISLRQLYSLIQELAA